MTKQLSHIQLTDTLSLSECTDGFWLYDTTRGMNLSIRAKTAEIAFVEALMYYQTRLKEVKDRYNLLDKQVNVFVSQFIIEDWK